MSLLPPEDQCTALLEALAEICEAQGQSRFLSSTLIEPIPDHFPDPWAPDLRGAATLFNRILTYASLAATRVTVSPSTALEEWPEGLIAWATGDGEGGCRLYVRGEFLSEPELLAGELAREAARLFRRTHSLSAEDPELEEELVDLTGVYLGFGVFLLRNSFRSDSRLLSLRSSTHSVHRRGALSPGALALPFVAQLLARGMVDSELTRLRRLLGPTPAAAFDEALKWLREDPERFRKPLALGPARFQQTVSQGVSPRGEVFELPDQPPPAPSPKRVVFRMPGHRGWITAVLSFFVGGAIAGVTQQPVFLLLPVPGFFLGRLLRRNVCATCEHGLAADAERCDWCEAIVGGEVAKRRDRFEAEDRWLKEQDGEVRGGLE